MRSAVFAAVLISAAPAFAQSPGVHTLVEVNAANGRTLVTHHLDARTIAPLLPKIARGAPASLEDPAAAEVLGRYVGRAFRIGVPLKLESYAAQDGRVLITYSAQLPVRAAAVTINSDLFEDVDPAATTDVEVRSGAVTRMLRFKRGSKAQTVSLAPQP